MPKAKQFYLVNNSKFQYIIIHYLTKKETERVNYKDLCLEPISAAEVLELFKVHTPNRFSNAALLKIKDLHNISSNLSLDKRVQEGIAKIIRDERASNNKD